jgi:signal transduction histidine kinase
MWGCLLPIGDDLGIRESGQNAIERFVHKLGNHFTLLHVILGSLRRVLPASRETEVLHETVDRAISLTRSFAEYNQGPSCWLESVETLQVLEGALIRVQPLFLEKGVGLEERIDVSLENVFVSGDPFLLELALAQILRNAAEATTVGGKVSMEAWAELDPESYPNVRIRIRDKGVGIGEDNLHQVCTPFFSTKDAHEGLGLAMALRFVEMHRGFLQLSSQVEKGTEVNITLPATSQERF